uniref:Uncharacterized protein n=1 Tax=Candidatus Kentrum sp. LFY TaxID=2126342 RepID=A0A450WDB1_9GAMM|nr:MAG: hypothetical protein BECKLFY1418C_GA0070996_101216 [Candidatus Kentron sp. LFY]
MKKASKNNHVTAVTALVTTLSRKKCNKNNDVTAVTTVTALRAHARERNKGF